MNGTTPQQQRARVVRALEELLAEEAVALRALDFDGVALVQDRAQALVDFLVSQAGEGLREPELAARLRAVHSRRQETSERLGREIARTRAELAETHTSQRRVAQVAPAYAQSATSRRQLSVVG